MVLSNKKLKRRLRSELTESLANSVAGTDLVKAGPTEPDPNSQSQLSLKELLDSATQRPRLSKREKRRKIISLQGPEAVNKRGNSISGGGNDEENKGDEVEKEGGSEGVSEKKKKKKERKRKREKEVGDDGALGSEENGVVKEAKKSKKKKKKKKKKKAESEVEEKKGDELGSEGQGNGESQAYEDFATKVYVGGIPYYSTEDDIRAYFESCGTITEVDCMIFPDSGKFRGIAIINFKTEAAAKRALALDGADMGGLYLKIQPYKATQANKVSDFAPKFVEGYNRIYIGNLSWDITEDELRKLFSDCNISSIRFGKDKETGEFRGYAHVDFSDSLSLTVALKLDQQIVCGRPVKISCAVPKKEGGTLSRPVPKKEGGTLSRPIPATTSNGAHSRSIPTTTSNGVHSRSILTSNEADNGGAPRSIPTSNEADNGADNGGNKVSSGKIKRRTCYECGEKGHLSSACPKKHTAETTDANAS